MDQSRFYQKELSSTLGLDNLLINTFTRRLIYERPLLTVSGGNFEIPISLSFNQNYHNTDFNSLRIGSNNGWKLNIEQYIVPYVSDYELEGFNAGDYVYIDGQWQIHRFIQYGVRTINNKVVRCFYDYHNDTLKMHVYTSGECEVYDLNNNRLYFNSDGKLYKIVSGVNSQISKLITFENGNIRRICDERDQTVGYTFEYLNNLISKVIVIKDQTTLTFMYNANNLLNKIKQTFNNETKEKVLFEYYSNNALKNIIDLNSNLGFNIDYEVINNHFLVGCVKEITYKKEVTKINDYKLYASESNTLKEGKYCESNGNYFYEEEYEVDLTNYRNMIIYQTQDNYLRVRNEEGIEVRYYFDIEGIVISMLEHHGGENYYSQFKTNGWLISEHTNSNILVNNNTTTVLTTNKFFVNVNQNNQDNNFYYCINQFNHDISKRKNPNLEDFIVSFWLQCSNTINKDLVHEIKIKYSDKTISKKFRMSKALASNWQYVQIPIIISDDIKNVVELEITFNNEISYGIIDIADVRLGVGTHPVVYIDDVSLDDEYTLSYELNTNASVSSSNLYMSVSDVEKTYQSMYENHFNGHDFFDLTCCNGLYVLDVKNVTILGSDDVELEIDSSGITNYIVHTSNKRELNKYDIVELQHRYTYFSEISRHIHEIKTSYGTGSRRKTFLGDDGSKGYIRRSIDGLIYSEQDGYNIIKDYVYDDFGNLVNTVVKNENDPNNQRIITTYEYQETSILRKKPRRIYDSTTSYEYNYDDVYGYTKDIIFGKLKIVYEYDMLKQKLETIKFYNKDTNELLNTTNISENYGMPSKITKDGINFYKFFYNNDLELNKIYCIDENSFNITKEKTTNETKYKTIKKEYSEDKTEVLDYVKEEHYDKYGRIKIIKEGIQDQETFDTTYTYQGETNVYSQNGTEEEQSRYNSEKNKHNESLIVQKPIVIYDPYRNVSVVYYYDGSNNVIGYDERQANSIISNGKRIEKYILDEDKTRYTLYDYYNESENLVYFQNVEYDTSGILKTPYKRIERLYYTVLGTDGGEYDMLNKIHYQYQYDLFGRITKKTNKEHSGVINSCTINNTYDNNCNLLRERNIQIEKEIVLPHDSNLTELLEYDTINKTNNITKITNNNTLYLYSDEFLQETITREFEYDAYGNLTKENNSKLGNYDFEYDTNGNIIKIKKNNEIEKEFTYENNKLLTYKVNNQQKAIEYDLRGNITRIGTRHFKHNEKSLISSYVNTNQPNITINYSYSNNGLLYQKTKLKENNGTTEVLYKISYYMDNDKILAELREDESGIKKLHYFYDIEGITSIVCGEKVYTLLRDSIGNISQIVANGTVIAEYNYDAWGNTTIDIHENGLTSDDLYVINNNPFRYKGYYYDVETQLFYCNSRYYSPELCRFISPDSIEYIEPESINGLNLYAYCGNDPINKYDPTGHFAITLTTLLIGGLIAGAIGAGIGLGTAVYKDVKEDGVWFNGDWTDYVGRTIGGFVAGFGVGICTVLGAGVGAAALGGTTATLFTSTGLTLSLGSALGISSGVAFATGMAGYAVRTGISRSEDFKVQNMFIEGGFNAVSGALSVLGGYLGGMAGVHNTVFTKLLSQKGDFWLRLLVENVFTAGFKLTNALIKPYFMI